MFLKNVCGTPGRHSSSEITALPIRSGSAEASAASHRSTTTWPLPLTSSRSNDSFHSGVGPLSDAVRRQRRRVSSATLMTTCGLQAEPSGRAGSPSASRMLTRRLPGLKSASSRASASPLPAYFNGRSCRITAAERAPARSGAGMSSGGGGGGRAVAAAVAAAVSRASARGCAVNRRASRARCTSAFSLSRPCRSRPSQMIMVRARHARRPLELPPHLCDAPSAGERVAYVHVAHNPAQRPGFALR